MEKFSHEEYQEEQERLKANDPRGNKKGQAFFQQKFVPAEEIADPDSLEEQIERRAQIKEHVKEHGPENAFEPLSPEEIIDQEKASNEKMSEEIGFLKKEGVAHVGPSFSNSNDFKEIEKSKIKNSEKDLEELDPFPATMSVKEISLKERAQGKDNRKTMSDSKKARNIRGKIREILHLYKN